MILFLLLAKAYAADLVKAYPREVLRFEVVDFQPAANHHFSMEAPQKCGDAGPVERSPRTVKCQFTREGEAAATLNVCDDAKTFCKPVPVSLHVRAGANEPPARLLKNETLNQDLKKTLVPGFIADSPEKVRALAREKNQPVFVMISTDWCPPCNEAKEYLLKSDAFSKATEGWLKVYVDGDSLAAAEWEKTVPYKYYPSFVLLNSRMEEIGRFNSELREGEFGAWAKEQSAYLHAPIKTVREAVFARERGSLGRKLKDLFVAGGKAARERDIVRYLRWALDQNDTEGLELLRGKFAQYPEIAALTARHEYRRDGAQKPDKIAALNRWLDAVFGGDDWAEALELLCEEDESLCRKQLEKVPERIGFLSAREGLTPAEKASVLGEEYYYLSVISEKLKDVFKQKIYAEKCVGHLRELRALSGLKLARGAQQNLIPCLEMAGRSAEAEKLLAEMIKTYPHEPTFMVRLARLQWKKKRLKDALSWIEKGDKVAYGYNWFNAQLIKTEILLDLGRGADARRVIEGALAEVRVSDRPEGRNQTLVRRLRATQTKIQERLAKSP